MGCDDGGRPRLSSQCHRKSSIGRKRTASRHHWISVLLGTHSCCVSLCFATTTSIGVARDDCLSDGEELLDIRGTLEYVSPDHC